MISPGRISRARWTDFEIVGTDKAALITERRGCRRWIREKQVLYKRIIEGGTVNEPEGKPDPQFALPSTVNWMRALAILLENSPIDFCAAKDFYAPQGKRDMGVLVENTVLEQLFLGLHHLSALEKMKVDTPVADYARIGILAWYYGVTNAASAMTAAQNGSFQEDHSGTARMWDSEIAVRGLAMEPFSWRVSSLLEGTFKPEVQAYRGNSSGELRTAPLTTSDAKGAAAGYLSGSAKWYAWKTTEEVRASSAFRDLGVSNFLTKAARELRNSRLAQRSMGFVHQASRYRGKANYREALFLAYGKSTETILQGFVADQSTVLRAFLIMSGAFASRKLGKAIWTEFLADVEANRAFTTTASSVRT